MGKAYEKTDNHNPASKLCLRRYFLDKYHSGGANVLDCCQGSGLLWTELQKTHKTRSYWGVDIKPKKGRLKIDSVRILSQPGWNQDCIDVDTYGSPWKHWIQIQKNLSAPTTVFLTIATIKIMGGNITTEEKEMIGLSQLTKLPQSFCGKLARYATQVMLTKHVTSCNIVEAVEAMSSGNARYIGVRLDPQK